MLLLAIIKNGDISTLQKTSYYSHLEAMRATNAAANKPHTLDEQSAHALLGGKRCNRRTTSSEFSSTTLRRRWDGVDDFRASPGLDSMMTVELSIVIYHQQYGSDRIMHTNKSGLVIVLVARGANRQVPKAEKCHGHVWSSRFSEAGRRPTNTYFGGWI